MTRTSRSIVLDAISQLASIYMSHHKELQKSAFNAVCKDEDYDLIITIEKIKKPVTE